MENGIELGLEEGGGCWMGKSSSKDVAKVVRVIWPGKDTE